MKFLGSALLAAGVAVVLSQPATVGARQDQDVTVRGCVERDAASRAPVYKLIADGQIYLLEATANVNVAAELGHTVDATGSVSRRDSGRAGRQDVVLTVKQLKMVSDHCS